MADEKKTPVETITHPESRANIPPAELESVMDPADREPIEVAYERRNRDLDPQLVWRGKDVSDWSDLVVDAPPIFVQEQVHPKALIEDLRAHVANGRPRSGGNGAGPSLFDHFGLTDEDREAEIEFYRHTRKWSNRMILGDSLQVMASLAEREGLRGKVQCIYFDPPYGIRFNSNFQWSTTSRDVKDGNLAHLTREPEQVKAFRDTWRDGIHSYLTYLRDRLTVARDLLTESGSIFVQIGDENVHRVRALMDEVFGEENFVNTIIFKKKSATYVTESVFDEIIWYCRDSNKVKARALYAGRGDPEEESKFNSIITEPMLVNNVSKKSVDQINNLLGAGGEWARVNYPIVSQHPSETRSDNYKFHGLSKSCGSNKQWRFSLETGLPRVEKAGRIFDGGGQSLGGVALWRDWNQVAMSNIWTDMHGEKFPIYVVQTSLLAVQRCILMTADPGDLVLDPTCGSGTTATVAEQWGRRWITIDTSRVSLSLARARIMGAKYPYYLLADSPEGQRKEAEVTRTAPSTRPTSGDIRQGFVYERVPHITLKSIANNTEIDIIWEKMQPAVEGALADLNAALQGRPEPFPVETGGRAGKAIDFTATGTVTLPSGEEAPANGFMEWEVPRTAGTPWPEDQRAWHALALTLRGDDLTPARRRKAEEALAKLNAARGEAWTAETLADDPITPWPWDAEKALETFWEARIARQTEIDASIAAKADHEYLYDKPYEDKKRIRVAGPFTVESLAPHRSVGIDDEGELIDDLRAEEGLRRRENLEADNYYEAILENLRKAGVQQRHKDHRIEFTTLKPWPGEYISADGRYQEGEREKRAAIFVGPEYGTVQRADLVAAAREAAEVGFDVVIACAFNFDAHAGEFDRLGALPILRARMNADLHMAGDLKAGGGNLFVVFGEPDIEVESVDGNKLQVRLKGVDVFRPQTGEVVSSDADDIACWFVDTDYDMESFFVRHAYFPAADVPYKALKTTLKAEIDEDAWESLKRTVSRPFLRPRTGRIAVKVINHLGDEVMKVMKV